ncbi:type VII secretion integral membrane protein EccD [Mycobacterium ostraviense]|uniref:Type VII secretion integral membrane protein EccD n=1 Tax=Mycobacterium ostraviense TaxID=2738409 RepID=A0A164A200_9MYCO|nr:type VII secretion integral membrane protein EccD [Mycobacterium ostraviense]KZS62027.1 type VII secretion integral membrane protein EccD [Mycobacterium ostraviense]UGT90582.1 type VII secretion integral membrane protein EccD [Mycobacterium ostraviense]
MSAADPGLRRVAVHAGTTVVDMSLPAALPVAALIPPIIDVLGDRVPRDTATGYHLCTPGGQILASATTLAQSDIRDGALLVLSRSVPEPPAQRHDDLAEAVSATLGTAAPRPCRRTARLAGALATGVLTGAGSGVLIRDALHASAQHGATAALAAAAGVIALLLAGVAHRIHRDPIAALTLSAIATVFVAVAGLLAVPGAPGVPHAMLAATAAAVAAALAIRLTGYGAVTLTIMGGCATVIAVAALAGVITAAPVYVIGSWAVLASLGLLEASARMSIALAGLSPRLPPAIDHDDPDELPPADVLATKSMRADNWLTSLLAIFSGCAAIGAIVGALTTQRAVPLAATTAALLLLRARAHRHRTRWLLLVISGIATGTTAFLIAAANWMQHGVWIAALTAILAAAAMFLGFVAPGMSLSPAARRGVETLELAAWVAVAPLVCWTCGVFGAIRALDLI